MGKKIWLIVERIGIVWTFLSVLLIVFDFLGLLPYYDIQYKRKSEIVPRASVYPGQNVRLSAEFASPVELPNIERVIWSISDATGKSYDKLPTGKEIDVALLPDYSGIINVSVKAKLRDESGERSGAGSIHIVQSAPTKIDLKQVKFLLPKDNKNIETASLEVYQGNGQWEPAIVISTKPGEIRLASEKVPTWDAKGFVRYKTSNIPEGKYEYKALTMINGKQGEE